MGIKRLSSALILRAILFVAAVAPAVGLAAPVSADSAGRAARAWTARGKTLGARMGKSVGHVATHATTNGTSFYAVKMQDGGTVFLSSDTEVAPVIGFTAEDTDFSTLDPKGPLWALLNADLSARGAAMRTTAARVKLSAASATASAQTQNEQLWADLLAEADATNTVPRLFAASAIKTDSGIGDLRVAPLVKSKWSQSTAWNPSTSSYKACYNYYTPNGPDTSAFVVGSTANAVCGCVATAMSQVMRYHCHPTASIGKITRTCTWTDSSKVKTDISLTTQGGTFDWANMTLVPSGASMSDVNYRAIGKLTSDAGISVCMGYSAGGSGAYSFDITYALLNVWGYKSAVHFDVREVVQTVGADERIEAFRKTLFANFDAGYPVCMGIPGHAIVADGYGYNAGYDYVHLNLGWAGSSDFWYNLPNVTEASSSFTSVDSITYNIFPDKGTSYAVVSGRVTDGDGAAVAGAAVQVWSGSTLAGEAVSTSTGVWGVAVPKGTYSVVVTSADGTQKKTLTNVAVKTPETASVNWNSLNRLTPSVFAGYELGNSWGNDVVLDDEPELESVVVRGPAKVYKSTSATYVCAATYSDGSEKPVSATWSISNAKSYGTTYATLSSSGVLTAKTKARSNISVNASYTEDGVTKTASLTMSVVTSSDPRPSNDNFAKATAIAAAKGSATAKTTNATDESGEPLLAFVPSATGTVWWKWTAPAGGLARFDTAGSAIDTVMGVYRGSSLTGLTKVAENDDSGAGTKTSACEFACTKGTAYYIAVGGWCGTRGDIALSWQSVEPVAVPSASTFVYDGTVHQGVATGAAYALSGTVTAKDAGSYQTTVTPKDGYCWPGGSTEAANVNWSIGQAPLTVTATNATVIVGEEPVFGATCAGFVAGEDESALGGAIEFSCAYEPQTAKVGETYAIWPVMPEDGNYAVTCVEGVLTVVQDPRRPGTLMWLR